MGLQNSELQFGIRISKTEPCYTILLLEFLKSRNSKKKAGSWNAIKRAGESSTMLATRSTPISQCFVTWMMRTNLVAKPILNCSAEFDKFRTD